MTGSVESRVICPLGKAVPILDALSVIILDIDDVTHSFGWYFARRYIV